jgi:NADPH:quinone reductase
MRAVGYRKEGPIESAASLEDIELPEPAPGPRDLLVRVEAVSVNPVDTKVRKRAPAPDGGWKVLGFDAAGTVSAVGAQVTRFKPGDAVYYAGDIARPGTNAELHLVDERIVGRKPLSLGFADAAALPLTAITAWEMLFDRLDVARPVPGGAGLLIVGGAGGVGSIAVQIARRLTDLAVIATASRPETRDWVETLGAHHVIDHSRPLDEEVERLGLGAPGFVFSTTRTDLHLAAIAKLIAPQGRFGLIDDPGSLDASLFKTKCASVHWEFMFTRPSNGTPDMGEQGLLLDRVSAMVDEGAIRTTTGEHFGRINAENLKRAHALIESGRAVGKVVLEGF